MREPLRLQFVDLIRDARAGNIPDVLEREKELRRVVRTLSRAGVNNVIISGPPGIGKTALIEGLVTRVARGQYPRAPLVPYIRLDTRQCVSYVRRQAPDTAVPVVRAAFASLPDAVVWIDDADALITECGRDPWILETFFGPFFDTPRLRLLLTVTEDTYRASLAPASLLHRHAEHLALTELSDASCIAVVARRVPELQEAYELAIHPDVPDTVVECARQAKTTRALPDRALRLLDEACAECHVGGRSVLDPDIVRAVHAERTGIPAAGSPGSISPQLRGLPENLRRRICGQEHATNLIADTVRRGWLGLRSPTRPIGAFLFLGPSGVGKTECAKALQELVYGDHDAFVRLDMSEFAESHMRQRLIGAPPGYIGHDEGGQLTNPVATRPFSLVLLDELEKAHPTTFDLFLQVLDDGRLTDGKGRTVDFTKTILIATSNLGAREVGAATQTGTDVGTPEFLSRTMFPLLLRTFRTEFLNRFDAIVVFRPLSRETLVAIARRELLKLEQRFRHHHFNFRVSDRTLETLAARFTHSPLGARPLKRLLETTCERAVAESLLRVTGAEPVTALNVLAGRGDIP